MAVIVNYLTNGRIPSEVIAATAPFLCFALTYVVASVKNYMQQRSDRIEQEEYEREVEELLEKSGLPEDIKMQVTAQREEVRLLSMNAKRLRLIARYQDSVSSISPPSTST